MRLEQGRERVDSLVSGTLVSRLLGFARDLLFAYLLGAGADVFLVAFRIPNFFRRLLAEGSLGMAYGAEAASLLAKKGISAARLAGREKARSLFGIALPLCACLMFLAHPLAFCIAPGLSQDTLERSVLLLRLCLPYLPLCLFSAIAFTHASVEGNFRPQSWSPAMWNAVILLFGIGGWLAVRVAALPVNIEYMLCAGLVTGGILQAVMGARCLRPEPSVLFTAGDGGSFVKWLFPPGTGAFLRAFPRNLLGAAPHQLHILAGVVLASFLANGGISALYFAERLVELPLGVAGTAMGIAVLPRLAIFAEEGNREAFRANLGKNLRRTAFLSLPAAAGIFSLAHPLAQSLFGHGAFDPIAVSFTAEALRGYSFAVPALCAARPLLAGVHAVGEKNAAAASALASLLPVVLVSLGGMAFSGTGGDAVFCVSLGISAGAWCNVWMLYSFLKRKGFAPETEREKSAIAMYAGAALLLACALFALCRFITEPGLALTLMLTIASGALWFGMFLLLGNDDAKTFTAFLRKKK